MHTYNQGRRSIQDVYSQVVQLFQNHVDLLHEFATFLPDCSVVGQVQVSKPYLRQNTIPQAEERPFKKARTIESMPVVNLDDSIDSFADQLKSRFNNVLLYNEFLRCLNLFNLDIISKAELVVLVEDLLLPMFPDVVEIFMEYIQHPSKLHTLHPPSSQRGVDLNNYQRQGPSYRVLPKEYQMPKCSGRTELCQQVLNDIWISVPTGSEDSATFKNSKKSQYEEILFKCEDDRFELDMVIEQNASTIRRMESVLKRILELRKEEIPSFKIDDDAFESTHLQSIKVVASIVVAVCLTLLENLW